MNDEMIRFLCRLSGAEGPLHTRKIGIGCSAHQAKARQDARRVGYALFDAERWTWSITQAGRAELDAALIARAAA